MCSLIQRYLLGNVCTMLLRSAHSMPPFPVFRHVNACVNRTHEPKKMARKAPSQPEHTGKLALEDLVFLPLRQCVVLPPPPLRRPISCSAFSLTPNH